MKISTALTTATITVAAADFIDAAVFRRKLSAQDPMNIRFGSPETEALAKKRIKRMVYLTASAYVLGLGAAVAKHIENR